MHKMKRISKMLNVSKKPLLNYLKYGSTRARTRYAFYTKYYPIKENQILYESFLGRGMSGNPYALFKQILSDEEYRNYMHVWVYEDKDSFKEIIDEYSKYTNVRFISRYERQYLKGLAVSRILISNLTFIECFTKREGQIYINSWHGIPLKTLGYDVPYGESVSPNTFRNFLQTDFLLAANFLMTEKYLGSAYRLEHNYKGKIVELGYPRQDLVFSDRTYVLEKFKKSGVTIQDNKQVILYAPTWKGNDFKKPVNDVEELINFKQKLELLIDSTKYQILVRPHYTLYKILRAMKNIDYIVPPILDGNETLSITDILIGDYSSIYFDFLATKRPILFYIADSEDYEQYRGFYFSLSDLPAEYTNDIEILASWILNIDKFVSDNKEKYQKSLEFIQFADKKNISKSVLDFTLTESVSTASMTDNSSKKIKLCFTYEEKGFENNLIYLRNVIMNIDSQKYDVTVYISKSNLEKRKNLVHSLSKHARIIIKHGKMNTTLLEEMILILCEEFPEKLSSKFRIIKPMLKNEVQRSLGSLEFDYVINFSSGSHFMNLFSSQIPAKKRFIFHSKHIKLNSKSKDMFYHTFFNLYDDIIFSSEQLYHSNKNADFFLKINNNIKVIHQPFNEELKLGETEILTMKNREFLKVKSINETFKYIPLTFPIITEENIKSEVLLCELDNGMITSDFLKKTTKFVTICKNIKNHCLEIIKAFESLQLEYPNIMLYIIDSCLLDEEVKYIKKKNLHSKVIVIDSIENPYTLFSFSDCYIFPFFTGELDESILVAKQSKIPIIMPGYHTLEKKNFKSKEFSEKNQKNIIFDELKNFIFKNTSVPYTFDVDEYNTQCYREFENLFTD